MLIAVDFDGTCVTNAFPKVGYNIGAAPVLNLLKKYGVHLILLTMRGNTNKDWENRELSSNLLEDALKWSKTNGVEWDAINESYQDSSWTDSKKIYADYYIDDYAFGAPFFFIGNIKVYDWFKVLRYFTRVLSITGEEFVNCREEIGKEIDILRSIV